MRLSELAMATGLRYTGLDVEITSIEYDSRKVKPGSMFCCIVGLLFDGHSFAESAVKSGAAALLVERELPLDVPQILVKNARKAMAEMAAAFYGYPQREMMMLGVTGTNGKTTTTYMVKSIAEKAGKKVGLIGTIRNMIGDESLQTDPGEHGSVPHPPEDGGRPVRSCDHGGIQPLPGPVPGPRHPF